MAPFSIQCAISRVPLNVAPEMHRSLLFAASYLLQDAHRRGSVLSTGPSRENHRDDILRVTRLYSGAEAEILRQDITNSRIFQRVDVHTNERRNIDMNRNSRGVVRLQVGNLMY